jgi:hypothetical protein
VTTALLNFLNLNKKTVVWEPSCGEARAMSAVIKERGHKVVETDIIFGNDYLTTDKWSVTPEGYYIGAIITNPPFELSEQFILKAIKEADVVAILLKSQYWHAAKRLDLFRKHPPSHILPLTWRPDFLEHERKDGTKGAPTMEVIWTVWKKGWEHDTVYWPLKKPSSKQCPKCGSDLLQYVGDTYCSSGKCTYLLNKEQNPDK